MHFLDFQLFQIEIHIFKTDSIIKVEGVAPESIKLSNFNVIQWHTQKHKSREVPNSVCFYFEICFLNDGRSMQQHWTRPTNRLNIQLSFVFVWLPLISSLPLPKDLPT